MAFNAHTLTRLPHLQALHLEFVPIVLLALDRLLVDRRVRDAIILGVACALQGLTSNYLLVFTGVAATVGIAVRADEWLRPAPARTTALIGLATAVAAALLVPFLYPYYLTQREQGLTRSLDEVALYLVDLARLRLDRRPPALRRVEPPLLRRHDVPLPRRGRVDPRACRACSETGPEGRPDPDDRRDRAPPASRCRSALRCPATPRSTTGCR